MKDWYVLLALRFISGVGVGILLLTTVYISDMARKNRPVILGVLAVSFPLGIVLSGGITYPSIPYWHQAFGLVLSPIGIAILMFVFYQNPRKGKTKEHNPNRINDYQKNLWTGILFFEQYLLDSGNFLLDLPTWVQSIKQWSKGQQEREYCHDALGISGIVVVYFLVF